MDIQEIESTAYSMAGFARDIAIFFVTLKGTLKNQNDTIKNSFWGY